MSDLVERLRAKISDANDFNGNLLKEWDAIRAACLKHRGSDLPRQMFEGQIENFTELMTEAANEIERLTPALPDGAVAWREADAPEPCADWSVGVLLEWLTQPQYINGMLDPDAAKHMESAANLIERLYASPHPESGDVEKLRIQLVKARAALAPLAKLADAYHEAHLNSIRMHRDEGRPDPRPHSDGHRVSISMGELRAARAALSDDLGGGK